MLQEFLQDLINNLELRLLQITEDSAIYDYCNDALDLIARDAKASAIYKKIMEITDNQTDIEDLNELLQTYDIEIKNYKKLVEENK